MTDHEKQAAFVEERLQYAEKMLETCGAVPTEINENRVRLKQRMTYQLGEDYYRMEYEIFDEKPFIVVSSISDPSYADIGLMEDIEAIPLDASDEEIATKIQSILIHPDNT